MKLSSITLSALLLAASASYAQQEPKQPKTETPTEQHKGPVTTEKPSTGSDTPKKNTLKDKKKGTKPSPPRNRGDDCPGCGMG